MNPETLAQAARVDGAWCIKAGLALITAGVLAIIIIRHLMRRQDRQLREWFREVRRNENN